MRCSADSGERVVAIYKEAYPHDNRYRPAVEGERAKSACARAMPPHPSTSRLMKRRARDAHHHAVRVGTPTSWSAHTSCVA